MERWGFSVTGHPNGRLFQALHLRVGLPTICGSCRRSLAGGLTEPARCTGSKLKQWLYVCCRRLHMQLPQTSARPRAMFQRGHRVQAGLLEHRSSPSRSLAATPGRHSPDRTSYNADAERVLDYIFISKSMCKSSWICEVLDVALPTDHRLLTALLGCNAVQKGSRIRRKYVRRKWKDWARPALDKLRPCSDTVHGLQSRTQRRTSPKLAGPRQNE